MNACFDTNRRSLPTQRMAHAEWMRSTRRRVWITPMTAEALAPLVDVDYLQKSRKRIVEELAREKNENQPSAGRTKRLGMEEEKMHEALRTGGRSILAEETGFEDHGRPQRPRGA